MIKEYLNQPYPFQINKWKSIVSISLFIGLFMLIFQPFGLSNVTGYKSLFCLGYGFVTFIIMIVNIIFFQSLFKNWFDNKPWTVFKQISWLIWIIFSIGLGNFIYTSIFSLHWNWQAFVWFQFFTLAVGLIPIIILTIVNQNRLLAENLKSANELNNSLNPKVKDGNELVTFLADNEKDHIVIELLNLIYIESTGNYIKIFYVKENQLKNELMRSTLRSAELQLEQFPFILKCHRAFLVNANKIIQVKGNSQGLRLVLKDIETEIPVSRNFSKSLKEKLKSIQ